MRNAVKRLLVGGAVLGVLCALKPVWAQDSGATAAPAVDRRSPVVLRPAEKAALLADMREYLTGLQDIFAALAKDDMTKVATRARDMGMINVDEKPLMFPSSSGVRFRELAAMVHEDFEDIAKAADQMKKMKKPSDRKSKEILGMMAGTMKRCVSCHESYRLTEMGHAQ